MYRKTRIILCNSQFRFTVGLSWSFVGYQLQLGKYLQTTTTLLWTRREGPKVCQVLASTVPFVVTMENTTNQWCRVFHK